MRLSSIALLLLIALLGACHRVQAPKEPAPLPVTVFEVAPKTVPADFEYLGVFESSHIVQVRARVEGYLVEIAYQEGALVQKDQLLFRIDPRPFQASLDEAKALLDKQKALLWNADQKVNRYKPLYAQNAISQKDLDDALSEQLAMTAQVAAAQANVETAALNLSFTVITAAVTSMSSKAQFREGALISPGPDSLLTTLYVVDPIWVNFTISQEDLLKARSQILKKQLQYPPDLNFAIEVVLADGTIYPTKGKVDFIDPSLQQNTGTLLVRAVIPNPTRLLHPGGFARVRVKGAVYPNALFVPKTSVQQGQAGLFVFVVDARGNAQLRPVKVGDWFDDNWIITEGLQKGDRVVVDGVNRLKAGSPVAITETKQP